MTGFGRSALSHGDVALSAEVMTVNQRGLAVVAHVPAEWAELELRLAALARETFLRGKVTLRLTATRLAADDADLSEPLARLSDLAARHGIAGQPDWNILVKLVEQQRVARGLPAADEALLAAAERCALEAFHSCDRMRLAEGEAIVRDLAARLDVLAVLVERMAAAEQTAPGRHRDKLLRRLADLAVGVDLADERVLKELAIHADRCDISEELTRLRSHLDQGRGQLRQPGAGRGLDFLTQEFLREVNTIGSKAAEIETTRAVLEAKAEIERFREQVQNLE